MPTLPASLDLSWTDFGDIDLNIPDQIHTDVRNSLHMSRPQVVAFYIANSLSVFGSAAIVVMARWVMCAVPTHRGRLWLITATALSNLGFALANLITDAADTVTTLPCIFFQLLTCMLVIISTFRLCGTFLFRHSYHIPAWTVALCPAIAFILATVPAAANQFGFDTCAQYCWYLVEHHPPYCSDRSIWSWATFYAWMIAFLSILFFSTILVLVKIMWMRVRSRAELRRFNRISASTIASLCHSVDRESGSDEAPSVCPQSGLTSQEQPWQANAHSTSASWNTTPEFITAFPTAPTAAFSGNPDSSTTTAEATGVRSLSTVSPRQNALDMAAAMAQRREAESWFLFAILRQALYPITITASGCIQIFVDLTLNDETAKRSTFEMAATVATSIQGFLFFLVFLFDPAVGQWRRMWKEYAVWKWYVEFYFSLGMPQEGKDFEDQFLANCSKNLDKDPSLARFLRPPTYAWSYSYQRYVCTNQPPAQGTPLSALSTNNIVDSFTGTTANATTAIDASQSQASERADTNQDTQRGSGEAIMLSDSGASPLEAIPLSSETAPISGSVPPVSGSPAPIDTSSPDKYTLNTSTPLATSASSQLSPPTSTSTVQPYLTSTDINGINGDKRRSWLHCGAATTMHPLSEEDEVGDVDSEEQGLPAASSAALSPFRAPVANPNLSTKQSKPQYIRQYARQLFRVVSNNTEHSPNDNVATATTEGAGERGEEVGGDGMPGSSHQSSQDTTEKHTVISHEIGDDRHGRYADGGVGTMYQFLDDEKLAGMRPSTGRRATIGGGDCSHNPYLNSHRGHLAPAATTEAIDQSQSDRHWWSFMSCTHADLDDGLTHETSLCTPTNTRAPATAATSGASTPHVAVNMGERGRGSHGSRVTTFSSGRGGVRRSLRMSQNSVSTLSRMTCCGPRRKFSTWNDRRDTPEINIVYQKPFRSICLAYFAHTLVRYLLVPKLARLPPIPFPKSEMGHSVRERQASVDLVVAGVWEPQL
ncbi:hypothetical protein BGZ73_008299 [Actinomortierella ambigua]|nr:hypothetical protein BGZ73_008299 [Actinomortierella ambigua]